MRRTRLDPDMPVDEIMRRWPATIRVFMRHRMLCVGCPIGVFHTVADACAAHGFGQGPGQDAFEVELLAAMRGDAIATLPSAFGAIVDPDASRSGSGCGA